MSVFEWMTLPYRRYAEFSGRSRRKEYWLFVLFYFVLSAVIDGVFGKPVSQSWLSLWHLAGAGHAGLLGEHGGVAGEYYSLHRGAGAAAA